MSTERGNHSRSRAQKHKNRTVFKNNLHDTTVKIKLINNIQVGDVCQRCKDIIEWKIKYKKYKPLTQPRTCVKCSQKNVKKAYHVICTECCKSLKICAKCLESKEVIEAPPSIQVQAKLDAEMKSLLQSLPERKRRTFLRYMNGSSKNKIKKGEDEDEKEEKMEEIKTKEDLMNKLNQLKLNAENEGDDCDENDVFSDDNSSET